MSDREKLEEAIMLLGNEYKEVLDSREYGIGKAVLRLRRMLLSGKIYSVIKYLYKLYCSRKTDIKYKIDIDTEKNEKERNYYEVNVGSDILITIYTCVIGEYDQVNPPLIRYSNCDYVVISDKETIKCPGWRILKISDKFNDWNNVEISRYVKFHPGDFFNTNYCMYIDGNVKLLTSVDLYLLKISPKTGLAMFMHPHRKCIYDEAMICISYKKGNIEKIKETMARYKNEGFPLEFGMVEGGIIVSDMNNSFSMEILDSWWKEFYLGKTYRDQLSFPYVIWKYGLEMNDIGCLGDNLRKEKRFILLKHEKHN